MKKFETEFRVRSYECDKDGFLRIITLMNILQEAADLSATFLGFGFDFCIQTGVAWVGVNYHIQINRMPKVHEKLRIQTWPSGENKFMAFRDFIVFDEKGLEIVRATSQWLLVDIARKRPLSLSQYLPEYMYIDERVLGAEFSKLNSIESADYTKEFEARLDDIDLNHHVNNALYPLWASESLPLNFREKLVPAEIEITFKKECLCGEKVEVKTAVDGLVSSHTVSCLSDPKECAHLRISWQNKY